MKNYKKLFLQAILAGASVSLGGTIFLKVNGGLTGAIFFSIGLLAICTRGYALFTGKACYTLDNDKSYLLDLLVIWLGNFVGTFLVAFLERQTILNSENSSAMAYAKNIVSSKLSQSAISLLILGFFCNIFIYLAVNGYAKNPHEIGKYIMIIFGVTGFILAGTEHCIADMYYFVFSGSIFTSTLSCLRALLLITIGNFIGAISFPFIEKSLAK